MKKVIILIAAFVVTISSFGQEVTFNEQNELQIKEVVQTQGLTPDQIFVNIQSLISETHPNTNSQFIIDYSDLKTGTIISKGKYWLGFRKVILTYGYDILADYNLTIRIKEGRTQILIKVPTVSFQCIGESGKTSETNEKVDVKHVYPKYDGYKPTTYPYYTKKLMKEYGPGVPNAMKKLYKMICDKITSSRQDDDF